MKNRSFFLLTCLGFGFAFLYVPILLLIIYSFNENRLVTVWSGFSTQWYGELLRDKNILDAAWVSLRVAFFSATFATALGTIAGMVMARFGRFRGRTMFSGMLSAPLVMPEVITGLSLLLMFVALESLFGVPQGRGVSTITIAHATFTMAFVAVIVQSRLSQMDESIEEAALDLGARPAKVFFAITLPIISPAIIAGWLLAFTMSLDDLVIASFTSGPSSTTLPMVVFSSVRLGVSPKINALATLLVLVAAVTILIAAYFMRRQESMRAREAAAATADG
ncbi:ABC transporter permease subunit [Caenispirillum bisanense]|uniref:ABC transporter permease subunit n=1 Tax=Caenispirillum bisanense TaxID=414052 RepID=UPI0031DD8F48